MTDDIQIGDWHIFFKHDRVYVSGPDQDIEIDGDINVEATSREIGHGYDGDHAKTRYIPIEVMFQAIVMWKAHQVPVG